MVRRRWVKSVGVYQILPSCIGLHLTGEENLGRLDTAHSESVRSATDGDYDAGCCWLLAAGCMHYTTLPTLMFPLYNNWYTQSLRIHSRFACLLFNGT